MKEVETFNAQHLMSNAEDADNAILLGYSVLNVEC